MGQAPEDFIPEAIARVSREDGGRLLACLIADLKDFALAEDCVQDAYESALVHWQRNGLPRNPQGWLMQTARRKAIDRLRRVQNFKSKQPEYMALMELEQTGDAMEDAQEIPDERLRLIFTCCHPALAQDTSVALTLRTLGGLTTGEIARAFVVREETMAQRLVRAQKKISKAGIPYAIPQANEWAERLDAVLRVIYLIFNAGYSATPAHYLRVELCAEAIRLAEILLELCPQEPEVEGLLALMKLHHARSAGRANDAGEMVALGDQQRTLWDQGEINAGQQLIEQALKRGQPGVYQLQAAIAAVHATAPSFDETDWAEVTLLYDTLCRLRPNAVFDLNRAVALSYAQTPNMALKHLEPLAEVLANYQPFHAAHADILRRCGEASAAEDAYKKAIFMTDNASEKRLLKDRLQNMRNNHVA
jgi:RNA polymerase sigma-70 factor (ECF subfamily)